MSDRDFNDHLDNLRVLLFSYIDTLFLYEIDLTPIIKLNGEVMTRISEGINDKIHFIHILPCFFPLSITWTKRGHEYSKR